MRRTATSEGGVISRICLTRRSRPASGVARRSPAQQIGAENEARRAVREDERAVGELVERCFAVELRAGDRIDALAVKLRVDRVGSDLAGM